MSIDIRQPKPSYFRLEENTAKFIQVKAMPFAKNIKGVFFKLFIKNYKNTNDKLRYGGPCFKV